MPCVADLYLLKQIRIQDLKKNHYGSGSRLNCDENPDPGKKRLEFELGTSRIIF